MEKREWKIVANCVKETRKALREDHYNISAEDLLKILECHLAAEIHHLCDGPPEEDFLKITRER